MMDLVIDNVNVLFFAQYFPPDVGGASTRAFNAALGLKNNGCDVTIITSFPHYPNGRTDKKYLGKFFYRENIDDIDVIRTWIPNLKHSSTFKRIFLHISFVFFSIFGLFYSKKPDVIFAMNPNLFSFFPANFTSKLFQKPIIRNVDDLWPEVFYDLGLVKSSIYKKFLNYITKLSYHIPVAIIPISDGYVKTIAEKYRVSKSKIIVVHHGVDEDFLNCEKNKSKNSKKIIMYSGAINSGYNFDIFLKSAKILKQKNIQFIIRGFGDYADNLRKLVDDLDLDNVLIDTDYLDKPKLISYMNKADIFLLPLTVGGMIDKGLPTKIFEYQALAKPIFCLSDGESANYIKKTKSGIVTNSTEPKIIADELMRLVNDESLCLELGMNGQNGVQQNLSINQIGKNLLSIIKKFID